MVHLLMKICKYLLLFCRWACRSIPSVNQGSSCIKNHDKRNSLHHYRWNNHTLFTRAFTHQVLSIRWQDHSNLGDRFYPRNIDGLRRTNCIYSSLSWDLDIDRIVKILACWFNIYGDSKERKVKGTFNFGYIHKDLRAPLKTAYTKSKNWNYG